jgi:hypothetical protein
LEREGWFHGHWEVQIYLQWTSGLCQGYNLQCKSEQFCRTATKNYHSNLLLPVMFAHAWTELEYHCMWWCIHWVVLNDIQTRTYFWLYCEKKILLCEWCI